VAVPRPTTGGAGGAAVVAGRTLSRAQPPADPSPAPFPAVDAEAAATFNLRDKRDRRVCAPVSCNGDERTWLIIGPVREIVDAVHWDAYDAVDDTSSPSPISANELEIDEFTITGSFRVLSDVSGQEVLARAVLI